MCRLLQKTGQARVNFSIRHQTLRRATINSQDSIMSYRSDVIRELCNQQGKIVFLLGGAWSVKQKIRAILPVRWRCSWNRTKV